MARYVPFDLERVKECLTLALAIARKELDDRQSCIVAAAERAEGAEVERDKLRAALEKINAIRTGRPKRSEEGMSDKAKMRIRVKAATARVEAAEEESRERAWQKWGIL